MPSILDVPFFLVVESLLSFNKLLKDYNQKGSHFCEGHSFTYKYRHHQASSQHHYIIWFFVCVYDTQFYLESCVYMEIRLYGHQDQFA